MPFRVMRLSCLQGLVEGVEVAVLHPSRGGRLVGAVARKHPQRRLSQRPPQGIGRALMGTRGTLLLHLPAAPDSPTWRELCPVERCVHG